jgi:poly(glycerol-phosphate) alpha-glucosyltransferase
VIKTANLVGSISRNAGGLHESVRRLVQSVSDLGVGVQVLTVADEFTAQDLPLWSPIPVEVFPPTWPAAFGYAAGFLPALERLRPDLTHTHGIWQYPSIATATYSHRHRVPYMISPHGMLDPWAVRHNRWKKAIAYAGYESAHVRGARCLRALCESEARAIRQLGLKNPIAIIPNGIDLPPDGGRRTEDGRQPSALCPLPSDRKVLLYLGRIHPKKGLVNLLRAWAQVSRPPSSDFCPPSAEWTLAIAGWDQGGHEAELKQLCDELGIAWADVRQPAKTDSISAFSFQNFSVLFLGPQFGDAKAACYQNCDAFILPSYSEGLPMVILEAWAYGKPVLMTPECNLPEGFAASAAIRIEQSAADRDPLSVVVAPSLVDGLRELLDAPRSTLHALGANGRSLVERRFTWPTLAGQLKTTYEWMLGSGPRPDWMFPL